MSKYPGISDITFDLLCFFKNMKNDYYDNLDISNLTPEQQPYHFDKELTFYGYSLKQNESVTYNMKYALMHPYSIQHVLKQAWKPGQFEYIPIIITNNLLSTINID